MQDEEILEELNRSIGRAEKQGDKSFFEGVLVENLIFRRASGKVVTKQQFLDELTSDAFEVLTTNVVDVKIYGNTAVVAAYVTAKREIDEQKGIYLNIRVFTKNSNRWQLSAWFNNQM